jgi:hypothetical protein
MMETQKEFYELYNKWKLDTMFKSYHDTKHPSYPAIVAMGKKIIPLLLSNLWSSWLPIIALKDILGEFPFEILEEDRGRFDNLNEKWYKWGESQGYI